MSGEDQLHFLVKFQAASHPVEESVRGAIKTGCNNNWFLAYAYVVVMVAAERARE